MSRAPSGSGLREHLLLFGRFLRSPREVGAIAPSSRVLARAMVAGLNLHSIDLARVREPMGSPEVTYARTISFRISLYRSSSGLASSFVAIARL